MPFVGGRVIGVLGGGGGGRRRIRRGSIRSLLAAVAVRIQSTLTVKTLLIVEAVLTVWILLAVLTVETRLLAVNTSRVSRKTPKPSAGCSKTRVTSNSTVTGIASSTIQRSCSESLLPKSLLSKSLLPKSASWIRSTTKSSQSSASSVRLSAESSWISGDGLLAVKTLLVVADGRLSAVK